MKAPRTSSVFSLRTTTNDGGGAVTPEPRPSSPALCELTSSRTNGQTRCSEVTPATMLGPLRRAFATGSVPTA